MAKPRKYHFRIQDEIRKYRGIVHQIAEKVDKKPRSVYAQICGTHIPKADRVQIPYTEAFNEITGSQFAPEELFAVTEEA
ncbi:MAG: hypothetical protein WA194_09190 [Patescibacteria group bacterium]